jgi:hypothetical protein
MKKNIERILFWFRDVEGKNQLLNDQFFPLATLLSRLLREKYEGKKIQFINIDFSSEETYKLNPAIQMNHTHYAAAMGGHLRYYGVIDFKAFEKINGIDKIKFIWEKANEYLQAASKAIKNEQLLNASEYSYKKGLEINLNPDYRMIQTDVVVHSLPMKAAVWVNFKNDGMYSKLTLEKNEVIIFEKEIDKTKNGVEFFLEMYKKIEVNGNTIIVKGSKDVKYLPLRIPIDEEAIKV